VREFSETLNDPHVQQRGLVTEVDGVKQIGSVFVFAENPNLPPPRQGEHTREVLREIGLSDEEIAQLHQAEIIKVAE
jgi:crotonobetainyl-CoA:carnitine CoA-transferase CaiB-like acyl-CoA transferase